MGFYRVIITNDDIRELFGNKFYELSAQKSFFVLVVFENIFLVKHAGSGLLFSSL
jgi:hypothetical protein